MDFPRNGGMIAAKRGGGNEQKTTPASQSGVQGEGGPGGDQQPAPQAHGLVSRLSTLAIDLEIMRASGFDGLEISAAKMRNVLETGFHEKELAELLATVNIPGIGFLLDIERRGDDKLDLIREAQALFHLARIAGARGVQVLTGPVDVRAIEAIASSTPSGLYEEVARLPRSEQIAVTAGNLALLADEAAKHGLLIYLESLAWTPLSRLTDQIELIARANRDNVRLVVTTGPLRLGRPAGRRRETEW